MQPTPSDVHVNGPLTNISVAYMQDPNDYVASKVFPDVPVQKQSDLYFTYDQEYWFRTEAQRRPPGTESAGSGFEVSTASYRCDVYAVHKDVDDQVRANTDSPLNADRDATKNVTDQLQLKRDKDWASTFFTTSVWTGADGGTDYTGVSSGPTSNQVLQWSVAGSDPVANVTAQRLSIKKKTGKWADTLTIGAEVEQILANHTLILDRIKYTQKGIVTLDLLASLFRVKRVLVAAAIENTADEGATVSMDWIYGKRALLTYAPSSPGLQEPSAGYTFTWSGLEGSGGMGIRMLKFRMDHLRSDRIEGEMAYDMKVVGANLGALWNSIVA